jgi:hypothetical protein
MKKGFWILSFLIMPFITYGQEALKKDIEIKISYFGDFIVFPGIKIGFGYPFYTWEKIKDKGDKLKTKKKKLTLNVNYFRYNHIGSYTNNAFYPEVGYNVTRTKGLSTQICLGIGYLRTSLKGDVYEVDEQGQVRWIRNAGRNRCITTFSGGIGYDFRMTKKIPVAFLLSPNIYFVFPETIMGVEPHVALDFELKYFFNQRKKRNSHD